MINAQGSPLHESEMDNLEKAALGQFSSVVLLQTPPFSAGSLHGLSCDVRPKKSWNRD